ncbi:MAG: ABC transporter substrate-binding protein, partial [Holophagales bacterium]|nr:ABC transporter substrate-binding protein [Holophagales bacterium]
MRLPPDEALSIIDPVLRALQAAHERNLVHRDLKPENIFLAEGHGGVETVKILDFGIARAMEGGDRTRLTHTGLLMGTPGFLAPEQIESAADADVRSDIYALGAILYVLVSGQRPFTGLTPHSILARQLREPPSLELESLGEKVPLADVVAKAMARNPDERFQTADELSRAVEAAASGAMGAEGKHYGIDTELPTLATGPGAGYGVSQGGGTAPPSEQPTRLLGTEAPQAAPPRRFSWRAPIAGLVVLLAAAALLWWVLGQSSPGSGDGDPAEAGSTASARGVTAERVLLGLSAAFTGPSKELGRNMRLGIETALLDINRDGGIHGRQLELIALDDGYEPSRTVANMAELLLEERVFAVLGNVGTPTAEVALPLALEQKVPFFGAFTGAGLLRADPPEPYVFNFRASYGEETAAIVGYFLDVLELAPDQIAVFAQEDTFGDEGYGGVAATLEARGYDGEVPRLGYRRNTLDVDDAVDKLLTELPQIRAVVLVATYRSAGELVRRLVDADADLTFASLSFVGSRAFAEQLSELGPHYAAGLIVSQVVPHYDADLPGVQRYRELLRQHFPTEAPGFVSLEGYLAARVFAAALERAGTEPTQESFVQGAESLTELDLGIGTEIHFGPDRHQGSDRVWGTALDGAGNYRSLDLSAGS